MEKSQPLKIHGLSKIDVMNPKLRNTDDLKPCFLLPPPDSDAGAGPCYGMGKRISGNSGRVTENLHDHPMKLKSFLVLLALSPMGQGTQIPEIEADETKGPRITVSGASVGLTISQSKAGRRYQLQASDTLDPNSWTNVGPEVLGHGSAIALSTALDPAKKKRFYRLKLDAALPVDEGHMVYVPGGSVVLGGGSGDPFNMGGGSPTSVSLSPYYTHSTSITQTQWSEVRSWAVASGYTDLATGGSKGSSHPVHSITWFDAVKWCNARSQMENLTPCYTVDGGQIYKTGNRNDVVCNWSANGYRLPTQAEWEASARAGTSGTLYPWGDTIAQSNANFMSYSADGNTNYYSEDGSTRSQGAPNTLYHPTYNDGLEPYTSPVGTFPANGYGLHDLVGNVWQWCWDWEGVENPPTAINPRGPATGTYRVLRGGSWKHDAVRSRTTSYSSGDPSSYADFIGFRPVRTLAP